METHTGEMVREPLTECVVEFFRAYGVACEQIVESEAPASADMELGSIIGFRGKSVRGGFAFVAPVGLIADLLPVPPSRDRELQLRDWSAEIANQLIGRLKNKLAAQALDFDVGSPVCFRGRSIRLVFLPDAEGVSLAFRAAAAEVQIHLDCSISSSLVDGPVEELRIAAEGEVILF